MDQALAGHVIEILASMSIEDVRTVVAEIEAFMAPPEVRLRHALRALADRETYPMPAL